ncbi:hypothetical protein HERIO_1127 [Hepatospora eriocheir]|uniref:Non-structural maintenance of chromosomes element 4 n=1 Tax=Hepatospora eriocheir TaxID=1081669 RepID=A0A1X0QB90_9MICR|nr:hypothetical protein HERIO_1127 [Hepatospora eriocheir]
MSLKDKKELDIPKDYNLMLAWFENNKKLVLDCPSIMKEILFNLNQLLSDVHSTTEFKNDIRVVIKTIKTEYESMFKKFNPSLTNEKIFDIINRHEFDTFFEFCKRRESKCLFADILNIGFQGIERKRQEKERVDEALEKAEANTLKNIDKQHEQEAMKEIEKIDLILKQNQKIEYFKLIIDPKSFSKTIYNAFNLSLATRLKKAEFKMIEKTLYVCVCKNIKSIKNNEEYIHSILSLDYKKYLKLIEEMNLIESVIQ